LGERGTAAKSDVLEPFAVGRLYVVRDDITRLDEDRPVVREGRAEHVDPHVEFTASERGGHADRSRV
jgi:hypothetical protein